MLDAISTFGELLGGLIIAVGFGMYAVPLGVIVAGILLCTFCWLAAR